MSGDVVSDRFAASLVQLVLADFPEPAQDGRSGDLQVPFTRVVEYELLEEAVLQAVQFRRKRHVTVERISQETEKSRSRIKLQPITGLGRHPVNTVRRSEMVANEATVEINMLPAVTVASR
jgi:hypothetical protein